MIYLVLTSAALLFTLFRLTPLGYWAMFPSYTMMAPYQGYPRTYAELVAEGKTASGDWEVIDLLPYFPGRPGERMVRQTMRFLPWLFDQATLRGAQRLFAERLLKSESLRGHDYAGIRLSVDSWPTSEDGWQVNHKTGKISNEVFLTLERP
jgi:hypothetical protein